MRNIGLVIRASINYTYRISVLSDHLGRRPSSLSLPLSLSHLHYSCNFPFAALIITIGR